jgi:lipoprotein-releasing system permease protein
MSRLPYELFLALRYLRPKRTFVSVITLISVIGVMLGVAVPIVVISVMTGFDHQLRDKLLGLKPHLRIFKYDDSLTNYQELSRVISSNRHVRAVAPLILGPVLAETQPSFGKSEALAPLLQGIDPAFVTNFSAVATSIISGELDLEGDSIVIGVEMARDHNLHVGDRLAIYGPRQLKEMREHQGKSDEVFIPPDDYTVRGIFDVGYYEYNANVIVSSLRSAQSLYLLRGSVHGLHVMLRDPAQAEAARQELRAELDRDLGISTWMSESSIILTAIAVEKSVMFVIMIFIVIVAAFGIMSSQITFVVQKTREIGMLKALGSARSGIMSVFLGQSLIVGVIGVLAGLGLGLLLVEIRNPFLHFMRRVTGIELFPSSIYNFSELPALVSSWDVARICIAALIICVLAGLVPAWTAGRLHPVEALRHE